MLLPKTIEKIVKAENVDPSVTVQLANNSISEAILDGLLMNRQKFTDFASSYEMKIKRTGDSSSSLLIKPKTGSAFSKIMQEVKATQTVMDLKLSRDERNISNISNILNSILKLKNIKKPLSKLPSGAEVAKRMKTDVKAKILEQ